MKNNLLPLGTRDEFGSRAIVKQNIITVIQRHFQSRGFSKISTPLLEKEEVFDQYQLGNYQVYRFLDQDGDTLVLRPDLTLPIARFLSSTNIPLPQKFFYTGDIFRISRRLSGSYNELTQAGVELIGYKSTKAELECLVMINQLSMELLDDEVEIELGFADFAEAIMQQVTNDKTLKQQILQALFDKKIPRYEQLIKRFEDNQLYEFLRQWPRLFGEPEWIFDKLNSFELPDSIQEKIQILTSVTEWIKQTMPKQNVSIDLSSRAPQEYYTCLTFRGFSKNGAGYIFSGGRYDKLLANFQDQSESAVGMGINIDLITDVVLDKNIKTNKTLIYFDKSKWNEAEEILKKTPNGILSLADTREQAVSEAKQMKAELLDLTGGN
ncbi:ATP phosphoribosyltransferase regulatory subunit [Companilactobacillus allii]|uniref:ATP phosphoribosyltransferase regulatory subunit n=1 Tax=Companilactobacillus allii TaxID=1847728 RepID=A0A1P8Q2Z0_9LACO|nr:ATP phosphoribosyltransferase regulatory subunit [Companilactobacillus allii]APX72252.1 ATP phosphoribosyltransferase regulatory subunit [Companilactobacillus allii]USQ69345.1 ATP phosphoribosyltransferase regulatory subunit [Companilactobacillus allii]